MFILQENRYQLVEQRHQIVCVGCFLRKVKISTKRSLNFNNPHKHERDTVSIIFYMCISCDDENITYFSTTRLCMCMCFVFITFVCILVKQSKRTWEFWCFSSIYTPDAANMNRLISSSRSSSQQFSTTISSSMSALKKVSHVIFDMDGLLLGNYELSLLNYIMSTDYKRFSW